MSIDEIYNFCCNDKSDINEHLPTLKKYTELCDTVVEMGVRAVVSTWAFLAGKPKKLTSIDIVNPFPSKKSMDGIITLAKENDTEFKFILGDTTKIDLEECDLLFIDTWHVYEQLKKELELHGNKAKKYLIFHDTTTFAHSGETYGNAGLQPAIDEFLKQNPHWVVEEVFTNNNGLTILKRLEEEK